MSTDFNSSMAGGIQNHNVGALMLVRVSALTHHAFGFAGGCPRGDAITAGETASSPRSLARGNGGQSGRFLRCREHNGGVTRLSFAGAVLAAAGCNDKQAETAPKAAEAEVVAEADKKE